MMFKNFHVLLTLVVDFINGSLSSENLASSVLRRYGAKGISSMLESVWGLGCTISPS